MSTKRPSIDLMALTSVEAAPMPEAQQRGVPVQSAVKADAVAQSEPVAATDKVGRVPTANLQGLSFRVPPDFRRRFLSRAAERDLKLNELLFAAFEAWEKQHSAVK